MTLRLSNLPPCRDNSCTVSSCKTTVPGGTAIRILTNQYVLPTLLALGFTTAAFLFFRSAPAADLMAVYLAGQQFEAGRLDQIYTSGNVLFDLRVPDSWRDLANAHALGELNLYPFVYPPLWAFLAGKLTLIATPQTIFAAAHLINPLLLAGTSVLAWRIMRPHLSLPVWMVLGLAIAVLTPIGFIALFQNQPQILVSFLIVLAIERRRSNAPVQAGLALALAASIKLFPVVLVLFWLARRDRPAIGAFVGFGACLAAASLLVGGLRLHLDFLRQVAVISETVMFTQISFNLDTLLGQVLPQAVRVSVLSNTPGGVASGMFVAAKPLWLGLSTKALLVVGLIYFWRAAKRCDETYLYCHLWPAMVVFVSLLSPLSWAYHYLSMVFFVPFLWDRSSRLLHRLLAALFVSLISLPVMFNLSALPAPFLLVQVIGTCVMAGFIILFLRPEISK